MDTTNQPALDNRTVSPGKLKLVLLAVVPLVLIISLAVLFAVNQKQESQSGEAKRILAPEDLPPPDPLRYPVEPEEKAQALENSADEFKRTKKTTAGWIDEKTGKPGQTTIIGDPNDPNWQMYKPRDVRVDIDKENMTAAISWTDSDMTVKPYTWMVGYWTRTFNPVESFQLDRIPEDRKILWKGIDRFMPEKDNKQKSITITYERLPQPADTLYFAIYIRTEPSKEQLIDYIFGDNNSSEAPFSQSLAN